MIWPDARWAATIAAGLVLEKVFWTLWRLVVATVLGLLGVVTEEP